MKLEHYRGIFKGKEIAILGNGKSLENDLHILKKDKIPCIGVNASWNIAPTAYHVTVDNAQLEVIQRKQPLIKHLFVSSLPSIQTGHNTIIVPTRNDKKTGFSMEATKGVFICRSSLWFALQLTYFFSMGESEVYLCGLDLGGGRIEGHPKGEASLPEDGIRAQLENFAYLRALIDWKITNPNFKVYITSQTSPCRAIPKVRFEHREETKRLAYQYGDEIRLVFKTDPETQREALNEAIRRDDR